MRLRTLFLCSALAGLAAGFGLNALLETDRGPLPIQSGEVDSAAAGASRDTGKLKNARRKTAPSALAEELRAGLAGAGDGAEQWLRWMTALEKAGPGDFLELLKLAQEFPGALDLLAARWIERDPAGLMALCQDPGLAGPDFPINLLARKLMTTWPLKDPDAVLAALKKPPGLRMPLRMPALETLCQNRTEDAVIAMSELGRPVGTSETVEAVRRWAAANPKHAVEVLMAHRSVYGADDFLRAAAGTWAAADPAGALAFASQSRDAQAGKLAEFVISGWVENDLVKASAWFASATELERERLLPGFMEAWGKKDAAGAMRWSLENTSGDQQANVVMSLVRGGTRQNPSAVAAMIADLKPAGLRTQAVWTFSQGLQSKAGSEDSWWVDISTGSAVPRPEAMSWLQKLDAETRQQVVRGLGFSKWSEKYPQSFAEFLLTSAGDGASGQAFTAAASHWVQVQPAEALAWAAKTPESSRREVMFGAFGTWNTLQPEAAMEWLRQRPADDTYRADMYRAVVNEVVPASAFGLGSEDDSPMGPPREAPGKLAGLLASDPAAAREAIGRLNFTPQERANVLNRLGLSNSSPSKP